MIWQLDVTWHVLGLFATDLVICSRQWHVEICCDIFICLYIIYIYIGLLLSLLDFRALSSSRLGLAQGNHGEPAIEGGTGLGTFQTNRLFGSLWHLYIFVVALLTWVGHVLFYLSWLKFLVQTSFDIYLPTWKVRKHRGFSRLKKCRETEEDLQPSLLSMDKWCKPCLWLSLLARTSIMQCLAQSSLWSSRQLCDASGLDLVPKLRVMMVQNHSHSATPFWDMRFRWQACYHAWSPKTWRTCHDLWPSLSRVARTARASATNRASGWFAWKSLK